MAAGRRRFSPAHSEGRKDGQQAEGLFPDDPGKGGHINGDKGQPPAVPAVRRVERGAAGGVHGYLYRCQRREDALRRFLQGGDEPGRGAGAAGGIFVPDPEAAREHPLYAIQ